ncbi:MAG TPA: PaaI family thioesterase [Candidatus Acidoferrum sp.]|jgi:uncharacterized protein (TIGR00369 family)
MSDDSHRQSAAPAKHLRPQVPADIKMPVANLIGFEITEAFKGRAITTLQTGPQHANPMGTLHGGILCDISDAAMGISLATTLEPNQSFTTMELKINFFRPVWTSKLTAEANVIQRGKTTAYIECTITDENNKLIAKASSTCMILHGDRAHGR